LHRTAEYLECSEHRVFGVQVDKNFVIIGHVPVPHLFVSDNLPYLQFRRISHFFRLLTGFDFTNRPAESRLCAAFGIRESTFDVVRMPDAWDLLAGLRSFEGLLGT
jgi:hypothetical protein